MIPKMDVRCGIDIVDISRILKKVNDGNAPFINKCFTEDEIKYCESANNADKRPSVTPQGLPPKKLSARLLAPVL